MSEKGSGPVKPPVLDLRARKSVAVDPDAPEKDASPAEAGTATEPPAEAVGDAPRAGTGAMGPALLGVAGGGLLGLAAAYGLAWAGLWPEAERAAPPPDPRIAELAAVLPQMRAEIDGLAEASGAPSPESGAIAVLEARIEELGAALAGAEAGNAATAEGLARLGRALAEGEAGAGTPVVLPEDIAVLDAGLAALERRLGTFEEGVERRLSALAAGSPSETRLIEQGEALDAQRAALDALLDRAERLETRIGAQQAALAALGEEVAGLVAAPAPERVEPSAAQLPLILSGLEAALAGGEPFSAELDALRRALPGLDVPPSLLLVSGSGLTRPDRIAEGFEAALPAMLASRPAMGEGWQDTALDWFRTALALRPSGAREGDDPEAVTSRLEAAIARRDFIAADALFDLLPEPMRNAAGALPAAVAAQADAALLIAAARRQALAGALGEAPVSSAGAAGEAER